MTANYYWIGSVWQVLVMIALLICIWIKKDCSGISLKSQVLYALVFTTRHSQIYYFLPENIVAKVFYLAVTYATVFSILTYLQKTYEKEHDQSRMDIWIVVCLILAMFFSDGYSVLNVLASFSFYIEAVAMIPQFQFILKTKRIDRHIVMYICAMCIYVVIYVPYLVGYDGVPNTNYRKAAAIIQLLLYADFFYQIYPLVINLENNAVENQRPKIRASCDFCKRIRALVICSKKSRDVETNAENEELEKGHLASNVGNIVLTASNLTDEKELPTTEDSDKN